jgi:peptidoglycan/xylan/chitin deacetylase (PgdA/CDA1 family)
MSAAIPVLLYHSVTAELSMGSSWGAVSRDDLMAHLGAIRSCGRKAVTITTLAEAMRGERPMPARPMAITFDDGYADTLDAVELLCDAGLPCTVYLTTGEVGGADRLTAEQVARLATLPGVELGAHAVRHRPLDELSDAEVRHEVRSSRARLEQLAGRRVDSFAYPHGAYDRRVRGAVIEAGYRSAAAVKNALSHPQDDPYAIARWTVTTAATPRRVAEVLDGEGAPLAWNREQLRTRAYRGMRRLRRRLREAERALW